MQPSLNSSSLEPIPAKVQIKPFSQIHPSKNLISESHDFEINKEDEAKYFIPLRIKEITTHCDKDSEAVPTHGQHDIARSVQPNVHSVVCLSASCGVDPLSNMHTQFLCTGKQKTHTHTKHSFFLPSVNSLTQTNTRAERDSRDVGTDVGLLTFAAFLTNRPISLTAMLHVELYHSVWFSLLFLSLSLRLNSRLR